MPEKRTIPRTCRVCGTDFLAGAFAVRSGSGLFCSRACVNTARSERRRLEIEREILATGRIPLRSRDGCVRAVAIVDLEDAAWASQWVWSLVNGYAQRSRIVDGRRIAVRLHRELLGLMPGDGLDGDHINRDKLDNRRSNLRVVPRGSNVQNVASHRGSSSAYRGVSWVKRDRKWHAKISVYGRETSLGYFEDEAEAAEAARHARLRLMPYAVD